ncbi:MAG: S8 family peptidase [Candidatus Eremiobacteraeota bacterium]|nr:S8 family peptidase [Candidatus Eremiobacteraeota bacterium]
MNIDKIGNSGHQKTPNFKLQQNSTPLKKPVDSGIFKDTFSRIKRKKTQYVIIPPKELAEESQKGGIFKSVESRLQKFNIKVEDKLPIIGGYVANLDEKTKNKLVKAGYYVFVDEQKNWLPKDPTKSRLAAPGKIEEVGKPEKEEDLSLIDRPTLEGPRFDTPLTRKYQGEGITIAVIDTGIYPHPDLITPNNRIIGFVDFVNGKKVPYDDGGHGTHVAGDAAGSGLMSDGLYKGPAPKANLIGLKALAGKGGGKTSDVIKSIEWCIRNKDKHNIKIINMSLGHTAQAEYWNDPTNQAVKKAFEAGIIVVAAAGNEGPGAKTVGAPGDCPYAVSVGAADDNNTITPLDDKITDFSSRGPTAGGLMKPDLVAPGEAIISTYSPGTEDSNVRSDRLQDTLKWLSSMPDEALTRVPDASLKLYGFADSTIDRWKSSPKQARREIKRIFDATKSSPMVDNAYVGMPGTSMAAPIVSGVVAQMFSANPNLKPYEVMHILKMTADKMKGIGPEEQGMGMVDPHEAIEKALMVKDGELEIIQPQIPWGPKEGAAPKENKPQK